MKTMEIKDTMDRGREEIVKVLCRIVMKSWRKEVEWIVFVVFCLIGLFFFWLVREVNLLTQKISVKFLASGHKIPNTIHIFSQYISKFICLVSLSICSLFSWTLNFFFPFACFFVYWLFFPFLWWVREGRGKRGAWNNKRSINTKSDKFIINVWPIFLLWYINIYWVLSYS